MLFHARCFTTGKKFFSLLAARAARAVPNENAPNISVKFQASITGVYLINSHLVFQKVEEFLERENFNYEWEKDTENLIYWYVLPPTMTHPVTGRKIWFTQPNVHHNTYYKESPMFEGVTLPDHMYPTHTYYGDGSPIEPEVIEHIRATGWRNAVGFSWKKRDVIVFDNLTIQHSRLSFRGDRLILAYLTAE